jgi:transcriptional regulator with XRE-family HTH domain
MSIGAKLSDLRLRKGESLQTVADKVGVSKAHIWELEKGRSKNPSAELVRKLAEYFGVTVEYLIDPEKADFSNLDAAQVFYRDLKSLSEEDQEFILTNIKMLRERSKR